MRRRVYENLEDLERSKPYEKHPPQPGDRCDPRARVRRERQVDDRIGFGPALSYVASRNWNFEIGGHASSHDSDSTDEFNDTVATNDTTAGREQNRRVTLLIAP